MEEKFDPYNLLAEKKEITNADLLRTTIFLFKEIKSLKNELQISRQILEPPKIPEPSPGDGTYKHDGNAAAEVLAAIKNHNKNPANQVNYIEFPPNTTPRQINTACKSILHDLMVEYIGPDYEKYTWQTASKNELRTQCKKIIRLAAEMKEFEVFRQTFNNWAIVWLASQKLKSGKKKIKTEAKLNENIEINDNITKEIHPITRMSSKFSINNEKRATIAGSRIAEKSKNVDILDKSKMSENVGKETVSEPELEKNRNTKVILKLRVRKNVLKPVSSRKLRGASKKSKRKSLNK